MQEQEINLVLPLLKANLGISSGSRDDLLKKTIESTFSELIGKGIEVHSEGLEKDAELIMLIVDYASWQYRNRGEGAMPRNIQYRLRNRIIQGVSANE